jgi:hypothetical protein
MIEQFKKLVNGTGYRVVIEVSQDVMGSDVPDICYSVERQGRRIHSLTTPCPFEVQGMSVQLGLLEKGLPRSFATIASGSFYDPEIWAVDGECGTGLLPGPNDSVTISSGHSVSMPEDGA